MIHTVKGLSVVNEAEIDVFLEFSCFLYDPMNVGNLISGPSAFSKSSVNIWIFSVRVQWKPSLKDFEYYLASMWNECNCAVVWTVFELPLFGIGMETDHLLSCGHCWVFHIGCHTECSTLTASSFRIWNGLAGISSPTLALFMVMLPKAHLTSYCGMSGYRWVVIQVSG